MFTIRHSMILTSRDINIKFASPDKQSQASAPQDPLDAAKQLIKAIRESSFSKSTEIQQLKELIQKAARANTTKKDEIIGLVTSEIAKPTRTQAEWDNREYGNPTDGDKKDLQKVLDVWQAEYDAAAKNLATARSDVKATTATNTAATAAAVLANPSVVSSTNSKKPTLKESAEDKDNNPRQAEAFVESLKILASSDTSAKALLSRLTTDNNGDQYIALADLNIASMMKWIGRGMPMEQNKLTPVGYTSNGMVG